MTPDQFTARVAAIVARCELPPVSMTEDAANKRVQIQFQTLPDPEVADLMKSQGFKFRGGPVQAWVRPLTTNARTAASFIMAQLTERTPEDNQ